MNTDSSAPAPLTERQRFLFLLEALEQKDSGLAVRYRGAILVLADRQNPARFALAAHGLRELCDELTRFFDLPLTKETPGLTEQVRGLVEAWEKVNLEAAACQGACPRCAGGKLRKFLDRLGGFFERFVTFNPRRRDRARQLVRTIDVSQRQREEEQEDQMVNLWLDLNDYFVGRAHHGTTTEREILDRLFALEDFLLNLLYPLPSEDLSVIDQILEEENASA